MEHHSVEQRFRIIFFQKLSRPVSPKKRAEFIEFFQNRFDIPHCPVRLLNLTTISQKQNCRIPLFIAYLHWQDHKRPESNFLVDKNFWPANFRRKKLKTGVFIEDKFCLVALLWPKIPCIA